MTKKQEPLAGTPEHYRRRAAEMRALAEKATTEEGRQTYFKLAMQWEQLAAKLEKPGW